MIFDCVFELGSAVVSFVSKHIDVGHSFFNAFGNLYDEMDNKQARDFIMLKFLWLW